MEQRAQLFFHHLVRRKCLEKQGFGSSLSLDVLRAACKRSQCASPGGDFLLEKRCD
jgi:hypothetical protein